MESEKNRPEHGEVCVGMNGWFFFFFFLSLFYCNTEKGRSEGPSFFSWKRNNKTYRWIKRKSKTQNAKRKKKTESIQLTLIFNLVINL